MAVYFWYYNFKNENDISSPFWQFQVLSLCAYFSAKLVKLENNKFQLVVLDVNDQYFNLQLSD